MQVKVLSVKNPFAYSIIYGGKDVENRTWNTDYRGRLYIHVSGEPEPFPDYPDKYVGLLNQGEAGLNDLQEKYVNYSELFNTFLESLYCKYETSGIQNFENEEQFLNNILDNRHLWLLQPQRVIGYVDIVDVVKDSQSPWAIDGQYHWILKNPTPLKEPICSVKGRLGLWNYNLPE